MKKLLTNKKLMSSLSLLLVLAMVLTNMSLGGVRAKADAVSDSNVTMAESATGKVEGYKTGNPDNYSKDNYKVSDKDGNKIAKTIEYVEENGDVTRPAFDITLSVETKEVSLSPRNAVVLVLDCSTSMQNSNSLSTMEKAVKEFIKALPDDIYVAIVRYGNFAKTAVTWKKKSEYNLNDNNNEISGLVTGNTGYYYHYNQYYNYDLTSGDTDGVGTNTQSGLLLANELLNNEDSIVKNFDTKNVVLFTDGVPTYYYNDGEYDVSMIQVKNKSGKEIQGNGGANEKNKSETEKAEAAAKLLKQTAKLYSVFLGDSGKVCYTKDRGVKKYVYKKYTKQPTQYAFEVDNACSNAPDQIDASFTTEEAKKMVPTYVDATYKKWVIDFWGWGKYETHHYCENCGSDDTYTHKTVYYVIETTNTKDYTSFDFVNSISDSIKNTNKEDTGSKGVYFVDQDNSTSLPEVFKSLATVVTVGSNGAGWKIVDPMGDYILFDKDTFDTNKGNRNISYDDGKLTWILSDYDEPKKEEKGSGNKKTTTYTYSFTYRVRLNTLAEKFEENQPYAANGTTTLYMDKDKKLDFKVPYVSGTKPSYKYTVNHYKEYTGSDKTTKTGLIMLDNKFYELAESEKDLGPVKFGEKVSPELKSYKNYTAKQNKCEFPINATSNVIDYYYDKDTSSVTVNRYLIESGYTASGEKKDNKPSPDSTFKLSVTDGVYVGESFTYTVNDNDKEISVSGKSYRFDDNNTKCFIKSIDSIAENNVIDLYYVNESDERAGASFKVVHHYVTKEYKMNNDSGKYELVTTKDCNKVVQDVSDTKATEVMSFSKTPESEYEGFTSEPAITLTNCMYKTDSDCEVVLAEGENIVDITFEKIIDERKPAKVTVTHNYVYNCTTIVDGEAKFISSPASVSSIYSDLYVGEKYAIDEQKEYGGKEYASATDNNNKLTGKIDAEDTQINLHYSLTEAPASATITVNHIYQTYHKETYTTTQASITSEGSVEITGTGERVEIVEDEYNTINYPTEGEILYKGQVIANLSSPKDGYEIDPSKTTEDVYKNVAANGQTITIYYKKDAAEDIREKTGTVTIKRHYYHDVQRVDAASGTVGTVTGELVTDTAIYVQGLALGSEYEAKDTDEILCVNGKQYKARENNVYIVLVTGENVIDLYYDRIETDSDLVETDFSAKVNYYTWEMTVSNGAAGYYNNTGLELKLSDTATAKTDHTGNTFYVGEKVKVILDDCSTEGYVRTDSKTVEITLGVKGTNDYTYEFVKKVPIETKYKVTIVDHYNYTKINANNTSESKEYTITRSAIDASGYIDDTKDAYEVYAGENFYKANTCNQCLEDNKTYTFVKAVVNGTEIKGDAYSGCIENINSDVTIDLYYSCTEGEAVPADVSVLYEYRTIDHSGKEIDFVTGSATASSYSGNEYVVTLDSKNGYDLKEVTHNGEGVTADSAGQYTVELIGNNDCPDSKNKIVVKYEKMIKTYENIVINHIYLAHDTYTGTEAEKGSQSDIILRNDLATAESDAYIGGTFTFDRATMARTSFGGITYVIKEVTPASITVVENVVSDEGSIDSNVITVYYVYEYSSYVPAGGETVIIPAVIIDDTPKDDTKTEIKEEINLGEDTTPQGTVVDAKKKDKKDAEPAGDLGELELDDDDQALGTALVKTGTLPVGMFYGFGALLILAALFMAFKKKEHRA